MLGFSFGKILLLIAVCVLVWRFMTRARPSAPPPQKRPSRVEESAEPMEDLRKCTFCGTYVPVRKARACGRADCPHG